MNLLFIRIFCFFILSIIGVYALEIKEIVECVLVMILSALQTALIFGWGDGE